MLIVGQGEHESAGVYNGLHAAYILLSSLNFKFEFVSILSRVSQRTNTQVDNVLSHSIRSFLKAKRGVNIQHMSNRDHLRLLFGTFSVGSFIFGASTFLFGVENAWKAFLNESALQVICMPRHFLVKVPCNTWLGRTQRNIWIPQFST